MKSGLTTQFSELWMDKFLNFIRGYPEEIRGDWLDSLNPLIKVETSNGIPYIVLYNPWREKRVNLKDKIEVPNFYESIKKFHEGQNNTVIFGEEYSPYYVLVNIFPLMVSHITIANELYNPHMRIDRRINSEDLETVIRLHENVAGLTIWHNMVGTAATFEDWEHFQGVNYTPPIRFAKKEARDSNSKIYTMPDYPGSNIVFNGERKLENTLKLIEKLYDHGKSHTIIIDDGYIYVIPVKDENAGSKMGLNEKSRLGGFETCGSYIALTYEDFEKFRKEEISVKDVLTRGLYKKEELNLFDLTN